MKKQFIFIIMILIIAIIFVTLYFLSYRADQNEIKKYNLNYEKYQDKTIYGTDVGSIINFAINNNEMYEIEKSENGKYLDDDIYCVRIEVIIPTQDEEGNIEENIYDMETINKLGTDRFVQNFNLYEFEIKKINYNSKGRVNYIEIQNIETLN